MTNTLIHGIINALSGSVSKEVIVFLISMIPIWNCEEHFWLPDQS